MSIAVSGFSVVVKVESILELLEDGRVVPPNGNHIADDHIWRCGFMAEADAQEFMQKLEEHSINGTQGPDSDAVIVSEFNEEIHPYCEWLQTAKWEKTVIAWRAGSDPQKLIAHEGFDPSVGSGLTFYDPSKQENLEFLRLDGNVEVYLDKNTGKELFIGRTGTPTQAIFTESTTTIRDNFRTAGEGVLTGSAFADVESAVKSLEGLLEKEPDWWHALFFHGKGSIALGDLETAFKSLSRAFEIEKGVESIPRELGGVCLELQKFDMAVEIGQHAAALQPDNAETLGNLALSYLLAGNIAAARKSIDAAIKLDSKDKINKRLHGMIGEVENGERPQPQCMNDLQKPASKKSKPFWKFWA